jgi:hypothetical protein
MNRKITISVSGKRIAAGQIEADSTYGASIDAPHDLSDAQIEALQCDLQILSSALRSNPEAVNAILAAGQSGDFSQARKLAEENKLLEQDFVDQGGGLWLALAVGAAILLYPHIAH